MKTFESVASTFHLHSRSNLQRSYLCTTEDYVAQVTNPRSDSALRLERTPTFRSGGGRQLRTRRVLILIRLPHSPTALNGARSIVHFCNLFAARRRTPISKAAERTLTPESESSFE